MSTNDVPGASARNADELAAGCWAKHNDGSLIFVEGTENDKVVFVMFDLATEPPTEYRTAMPTAGFKKSFSFPPVGTSKDKWTWHDKTPFPWDDVMKSIKTTRPSSPSAEQTISAAKRVADSLNARGQKLQEENYEHMTETASRPGRAVIDKITRAMGAFYEEITK